MLKARHSCRDGLLKGHGIGTVPYDPHTKGSGCPSKSTQHLWLDQSVHFDLLVASFHTGMDNRFSFVWLSHHLPGGKDRRGAFKERARRDHEWPRKAVLPDVVLECKVEWCSSHIANHRHPMGKKEDGIPRRREMDMHICQSRHEVFACSLYHHLARL
jgi:hypothetical protein